MDAYGRRAEKMERSGRKNEIALNGRVEERSKLSVVEWSGTFILFLFVVTEVCV